MQSGSRCTPGLSPVYSMRLLPVASEVFFLTLNEIADLIIEISTGNSLMFRLLDFLNLSALLIMS